ncbi:DUF6507 family protein [Clavibacter sp. VKM Ac-2872]|uniref:DUF6507 family protein n=1 Tax=Clavibacter sp. VKM Ac-2872 TaxID=2783812 RepID=UPI00188D3E29|nr:DUF6507 family protein [Clavibacter sp. VKM Ac-2872]MBF4622785.1 hypothetical protein [Clavibacter sp. VKM Ac-2872]
MTSPGEMGGWRIDPGAVDSVLADARSALSDLDSAGAAVHNAIDAATAAAGPKTRAALAILAHDPFLGQIASITTDVRGAIDQTGLARDAYVQGDEEMATQFTQGGGQ